MGLLNFLLQLVIAGVIGYAASALMGTRRVHIVAVVLLGFLGTIVGPWIANFFHLPEPVPVLVGGAPFSLVWSIVGAAIVVAVVSMVRSH
ncbi:GlsB/YeaQ/YmgE family stress response membrane protein [bacterium]|nr:GlsB/YeaQ/YmgE family stress response membrane protein [bacterium]